MHIVMSMQWSSRVRKVYLTTPISTGVFFVILPLTYLLTHMHINRSAKTEKVVSSKLTRIYVIKAD